MYRFKYTNDGITWHVATQGAHTSIASRHGDRRAIEVDRLPDAYRMAEFLSHKYKEVQIVYH